MTNIKEKGRYYTPKYIVENILDIAEYTGANILKKHVIDNSCGNGAFILAFIERYCNEFIKTHASIYGLKEHLEEYIHAIEIEKDALLNCKQTANELVQKLGIIDVNWDFLCSDALKEKSFDNQMDFVIGNPPLC